MVDRGGWESAVQTTGAELDSTEGVDIGVHAQYGGNGDLVIEWKKVSHLWRRLVLRLATRGSAPPQIVLGGVGVEATRSGVGG